MEFSVSVQGSLLTQVLLQRGASGELTASAPFWIAVQKGTSTAFAFANWSEAMELC